MVTDYLAFTYFEDEVVDKQTETAWGVPLLTIKAKLTIQEGGVLVDTFSEVELPLD